MARSRHLFIKRRFFSESRKLFGGYKITPRFCKPTRRIEGIASPGPNICMFNHECASRQGIVVGACMDGFLFGACCNLPGAMPGELLESDQVTPNVPSNVLEIKTTKEPNVNVMSNGFTELALTTGDDNVVQIGGRPSEFISSGVTHPVNQETYLLNNENNEIHAGDWTYPTKTTQTTERGSTTREDSTQTYGVTSPLIQISISHSPTTASYFQKPMFRPKPTTGRPEDDKYVLVPTLTHQKPNKTQELESIVNILQMLNDSSTTNPMLSSYGPSTVYLQSSTTKKPPSTSYVFSTTIPRRPTTKPATTKITTPKSPSTSYVYSSTTPPKRTTVKRPTVSQTTAKPSKRPASTTKPTTKPGTVTKKPKPPLTSYVFSSVPTRRPIQSTIHTASVSGPTFSVTTPTKSPYATTSYKPTLASSTPNVILIAPVTSDEATTPSPPKPVTQLTINNIVTATNNYHYSTSRPSPTIHITPKPPLLINSNGYIVPVSSTEYSPDLDFETSPNNDLINFPPVRNPNLNISASIASLDDDIEFSTPPFEEDDKLNKKVQTFVNKIVLSLQEPFGELKDVLYNRNKTTTKKPTSNRRPTKPTSKPPRTGTTRPTTFRPYATKSTTRKPSSKRPTITTRKPVTTTAKRTKPTKRVTTTPVYEEEEETQEQADYRKRMYHHSVAVRF